jgi:hypothetical protein
MRLWIEGNFLLECGFQNGDKWEYETTDTQVIIWANSNGPRKIAGTAARPIIDINSTAILTRLGQTGDTVHLGSPSNGCIVVQRHSAKA